MRGRRPAVPLDERLVDSQRTPVESAECDERARWLDRAMAQLTHAQREVLVLRHWLDLSYDEIADALQVPAKTVKSRLFSARTRLAELLRALGVEAP